MYIRRRAGRGLQSCRDDANQIDQGRWPRMRCLKCRLWKSHASCARRLRNGRRSSWRRSDSVLEQD